MIAHHYGVSLYDSLFAVMLIKSQAIQIIHVKVQRNALRTKLLTLSFTLPRNVSANEVATYLPIIEQRQAGGYAQDRMVQSRGRRMGAGAIQRF